MQKETEAPQQIGTLTNPPRRKLKRSAPTEGQGHPLNSFYLGRSRTPHKNTLFVDLDNTLVCAIPAVQAQDMGQEALAQASFSFKLGNDDDPSKAGERYTVFLRPGCIDFFENAAESYELVLFTAAVQAYADIIVDALE